MENKIIKKAIFLIDLSKEDGYQLFEEERHKTFCNFHFKEFRKTATRRFLLIDWQKNSIFFGSDSPLRPLGRYTKNYISMHPNPISLKEFLLMHKALSSYQVPKETNTYIVESSKEVIDLLVNDNYSFWHRPYFAMKGYTHLLHTIHPYECSANDSSIINSQTITKEEFIYEYIKSSFSDISISYKQFISIYEKQEKQENIDFIYDETKTIIKGVNGKIKGIIKLPEGVKKIDAYSFLNQKWMEGIIFSSTIETIEENAFKDCEDLSKIAIPKSIKQIHKTAFIAIYPLDVYYEGTIEEWNYLKYRKPRTRIGEKDGYAKYGNEGLLDAPNIHFECKF